MPFLRINDCRYHYVETGPPDGEPVAFAHGYLMTHRVFERQMEALSDRYRCIAWDWRGQGASEVTAGGYDPWDLALDAAALLEALGVARCHYVGLSMGGYAGYRLASLRPDLLHTLTLLDTSARAPTRTERARYYALLGVLRIFGFQAVIDLALPQFFGEGFLTDPARRAERERWKAVMMANSRTGTLRAGLGIFRRDDVRSLLGGIRQPVLLGGGTEDRPHPVTDLEADRALLPDARLALFPNAGHTSPVEAAGAVNTALAHFLHEHPIHD